MAGESQRIPDSDPDPSVYVQAAIDRAARHHAELVDAQIETIVQRLDDMDKAQVILSETVNRTPTVIQTEIGHVRELMNKDFAAAELRFTERDIRFGLQATSTKAALDAAFESSSRAQNIQEAANSKAIEKAEKSTNETIEKNAEVVNKSIEALTARFDDLRDRVVSLESEKRGAAASVTEHRASNNSVYAFIGAVATVLSIAIIVVGIIVSNSPN